MSAAAGPARTLIVMRHAKSAWDTPDVDHNRPLAARGRADAQVAGGILAEYRIDLALVSTAVRAQQTWQQAQSGGASAAAVEDTEEIYHAWSDDLIDLLREVDDSVQTVLLIGHQPTMSELVYQLAAPADGVPSFTTSAIAVLSFTGSWSDLASRSATLERFEVPRA